MKYGTLISLILIFSFTSCIEDISEIQASCEEPIEYGSIHNCDSDNICTSDICTQYLDIWQELLKEKNNLTQNFLDAHIELCETEVRSWIDGISFSVCYKFNICWAVAYNCDQFIIKINSGNSLYPTLDLPRSTYLTQEEIKIAVDYHAFSSSITNMTNANELNYINMESALNDLIAFSGVDTLNLKRIALDGNIGNLILEASAEYENEENLCIYGRVDLITGDKNVHDFSCIIIN
jgi:hypothetical protein